MPRKPTGRRRGRPPKDPIEAGKLGFGPCANELAPELVPEKPPYPRRKSRPEVKEMRRDLLGVVEASLLGLPLDDRQVKALAMIEVGGFPRGTIAETVGVTTGALTYWENSPAWQQGCARAQRTIAAYIQRSIGQAIPLAMFNAIETLEGKRKGTSRDWLQHQVGSPFVSAALNIASSATAPGGGLADLAPPNPNEPVVGALAADFLKVERIEVAPEQLPASKDEAIAAALEEAATETNVSVAPSTEEDDSREAYVESQWDLRAARALGLDGEEDVGGWAVPQDGDWDAAWE